LAIHRKLDINMALLHAQAGEVIGAGPLGDLLPETKTRALVKTQNFEVIRMVNPQKVLTSRTWRGQLCP
jgi:hypothetical protein